MMRCLNYKLIDGGFKWTYFIVSELWRRRVRTETGANGDGCERRRVRTETGSVCL